MSASTLSWLFPWTRLLAAHLLDYIMKPVLMLGGHTPTGAESALYRGPDLPHPLFLKLMKLFLRALNTIP